ncbi:MAG: Fic family protein, partial [Candidatus Rokuibacteriota bacterium]
GKWRPGDSYVRNDATGDIAYQGPDSDDVPSLMAELVAGLDLDERTPPLVRAAMAHLNLVMIHPFSDGNGRMARCLQSLVLARGGILAPQFSSVEEYLGANTDDYYNVLAEVGRGHWQPAGDARPWVRFMLTAHFRQAQTLLRRVKESEALWGLVEEVISAKGLRERSAGALSDAASGRRLRRGSYLAIVEGDLSEAVATRDLRALVEAGLLIAHGEKRGRYYVATPELTALRKRSRRPRSPRDSESDPYAPDESPTFF